MAYRGDYCRACGERLVGGRCPKGCPPYYTRKHPLRKFCEHCGRECDPSPLYPVHGRE